MESWPTRLADIHVHAINQFHYLTIEWPRRDDQSTNWRKLEYACIGDFRNLYIVQESVRDPAEHRHVSVHDGKE